MVHLNFLDSLASVTGNSTKISLFCKTSCIRVIQPGNIFCYKVGGILINNNLWCLHLFDIFNVIYLI